MKRKKILAMLLCVVLLAWGPGAFAGSAGDAWEAQITAPDGTDGGGTRGPISSGLYRIKNTNGKYLSANVSGFSQATTPSSTAGTELWYIQEESGGVYVIEPLGVRGINYGSPQYRMTANASGSSATSGTIVLGDASTSNTQRWYVGTTGGTTNFTLVPSAYSQLSLGVASTSATPALTNSSTGTIWQFENVVKNDFWDKRYVGAPASGMLYINVVVDMSTIVAPWSWSTFTACNGAWNGIGNVNVAFWQKGDPSIRTADFTINVKGESSTLPVGTYGITLPNGATETTLTTTILDAAWSSVTIKLNTKAFMGILDPRDLQKIFIHEVGHALKLQHPDAAVSAWHPLALMNQDTPSDNSYIPCRPSGYDKYNLARKWA